MPKTTITAPPQEAAAEDALITEVQAMLDSQVKLKDALAHATSELSKAEALVDTRRKELAVGESQHYAEHHTMLPDDSEPAEAFAAAQDQLERRRAVCGGLRRSISDLDIPLLSTIERLNQRRKDYNRQTVKAFIKTEFTEAQKAWSTTLKRAVALADSLGVEISAKAAEQDGTLSALILRPAGGDASDQELALLARLVPPQNWRSDASARSLHDHHHQLKELADALEQHRKDGVMRLMQAEKQKRETRLFDPQATFRVIRPFVASGKPYAVGDRVTSFDLRLSLLEKLHSARNLATEEKKDLFSK